MDETIEAECQNDAKEDGLLTCAKDQAAENEMQDEEVDDALESDTVTLREVIDEEERLSADAEAVLGPQDHTVCTFPEGYKPRQPIYSCKTCAEQTGQVAAICLGCSYSCHDGHNIFELYTKRNVCCDCGNAKFKEKCNLYESKTELNKRNVYNQNYRGLYCVCKRPYPDEDDSVQDEMVQCVVCEDWYHSRHLTKSGDVGQIEFQEMICVECSNRLPFLRRYHDWIVDHDPDELDKMVSMKSHKTNTICVLQMLPEFTEKAENASFFPSHVWRSKLCRCSSCIGMYSDLECSFLTEYEDTVEAYEAKGVETSNKLKRQSSSSSETGDILVDTLVQTVDKSVAIEMIHGYNSLKEKLSEYLKIFAEKGRVVQETDVRSFFAHLEKEESKAKRPRLMPPAVCR